MKGFGAWAWEENKHVPSMLTVKDAVGYAVEWLFLGFCALMLLEVLISIAESW